MTAQEARCHPWLVGPSSRSVAGLGGNLQELKVFNAKRKLKLAVDMVRAQRAPPPHAKEKNRNRQDTLRRYYFVAVVDSW